MCMCDWFLFFKQKTAYELRISDWSSDVCSSDLYGTANSNQSLLEAMGLQLPGSSFVPPDTPLREALTAAAVERAAQITALGEDYRPIGQLIDERAIVNAVVMLMATGGPTHPTTHWVPVARAAGFDRKVVLGGNGGEGR